MKVKEETTERSLRALHQYALNCGFFLLIYNNKKAILKLGGEVIDLPSWNITYASGHTRLRPPIELWQVMGESEEISIPDHHTQYLALQ